MGRNLKRYDEYRDKIMAYMEACAINFEFAPEPDEGAYLASRRLIRIDPDLDESTEIATMLHELGHLTDDTLLTGPKFKRISLAYKAFNEKYHSPSQMRLILQCEQRAWMYGRGIAKKLQITLGKWYDDEEKEALAEYAAAK